MIDYSLTFSFFLLHRSSGAASNSCSPLNATSGSGRLTPLNPRAKVYDKV